MTEAGLIGAGTGQVQVFGMVTATVDEIGATPAEHGTIAEVDAQTWESLREGIRAADKMPEEGEPTQYGSPFQARRRAQIVVLQEAWRLLFPGDVDMTRAAAKELLRLTEGDGEGVFEEMDRLRNLTEIREVGDAIKFPRAYLVGMLRDYWGMPPKRALRDAPARRKGRFQQQLDEMDDQALDEVTAGGQEEKRDLDEIEF